MTVKLRALLMCPDAAPSAVEPLLETCVIRGDLEVFAALPEPRSVACGTKYDVALLELRASSRAEIFEGLLAASTLPVVVFRPRFERGDEHRLLRLGAEEVVGIEGLDAMGLLDALHRAVSRRQGRGRAAGGTFEPSTARTPAAAVVPFAPEASRREREIRQVQKMEAVGTLAAGIAHDVNNILGSILGLSSVLCDDLPAEDHRRADAVAITEACKQGRTLVRNLMGFGRKGKFQQRDVFLGELLSELAESIRGERFRNIDVKLRIDVDLPPAQGDPDQLRHVLRNLVDNALEAMHTGGTLLLENRLVVLDENEVSPYRDLRPGSFLLLEVSDTGVGMDVDTQERAFEPFFTTRPRGEAKGLGLSMAYGAVRHHGGVIRLTSEPGKGTRVSVYLPVSGQASRRSVAPPCLSSLPPLPDPCELGRGRTALLVDDEELMRLSARRMLERFGFEVHTAAQGEIAVAMLAQDPQRYSLVLLDMIMPVLSGAEAFGKLRELRPDIPVLLCSGFARESQTDELLSRGQTGFLLKPFGLDALEKALMALRAPRTMAE